MQRFLAMALVLCLLTGCLGAALAEEDYSGNFDFFRSLAGAISFTLPEAPTVLHDFDLVRTGQMDDWDMAVGWQNKIQLHYYDPDEEIEIQYHIADLTPALADAAQRWPDLDEGVRRELALQDYAALSIGITGARNDGTAPRTAQLPAADSRAAVTQVTLTGISYDDMPGVAYRAVGYLDADNMAVLLLGREGPCLDALLAEFGPATAEQRLKTGLRLQPEQVTIGTLRFSFPAQYVTVNGLTSRYWYCFNQHYHMIGVEYMPVDLATLLGMADEIGGLSDEALLALAEYTAADYSASGEYECTTEMLLPGVAMMQITEKGAVWGEPTASWALYTSGGIYSIDSVLADDVLDFVHSITLAE